MVSSYGRGEKGGNEASDQMRSKALNCVRQTWQEKLEALEIDGGGAPRAPPPANTAMVVMWR
jgi:hypothetical protein